VHHQNIPDQIARLAKVNTYHVSLLAYYLEKLRSTPDGDGSLLDHVTIMYGAGCPTATRMSSTACPLYWSAGRGTLKGGRHVKAVGDPWANLLVTVMDKFACMSMRSATAPESCPSRSFPASRERFSLWRSAGL